MIKIGMSGVAYSPISKAYEIAAELQENDLDWTYDVVENPDKDGPKTAIIKVYDEDGFFIGNWGE